MSVVFSLLSIPAMGDVGLYSETGNVYGDVDASGALTSSDAASIMNKTLNSEFIMPVEVVSPDYLGDVV